MSLNDILGQYKNDYEEININEDFETNNAKF